jgi:6-phosphogluconolactonase (cycloisomerase 2 family)
MAQSYTRQSTFADGDTITAALFNDEYNQLLNAFAYSNTSAASTGHRHDGTAGEGGNIHTIGDLDFNNKIVVDSTNNRWGFYVEVSSAAVEQIRIQDGAMIPVTDSDVDLGTSSLYWKDAYIDSVTTTGNVSIGGNLTVTGNATISGNLTFGDADTDSITLTADVASHITPDTDDTYDLGSASKEWRDLYIDGTANIDSLVADTADINAGSIDNTTIGATTASTGNFSTLSIGSVAITSTAAEINIIDGDTAATATTLADADRVIVNDAGTMKQVALTDFETYFETSLDTLSNVTTVGALNAGSITSGFGAIDNGSSNITTTGTVSFGNLTDGAITITAFVDEDNMASDSATLVPTQQSVKAYVDSQIGGLSSSLSGLTDTNITTPADGALLFYDTGTSTWIDNVVSGDITIADTGVAAIGSGVIVNDDINASAAISVSKTALVDGTGLTLTGDTLSVDASQTQITAVGTIATGTWQGTAIADAYVADNLTISGGTVDNSVIGGTTAAAGTFTNLTASGTLTLGGTAVTATATEINLLDGVTATTAEINYVDGVTSNIQTQLDSKVGTSHTGDVDITGELLVDSYNETFKKVSSVSATTGYLLSSASYDSKSFSVATQDSSATEGFTFSYDGTKMYAVGTTNRTVYQYDLSTAFDVSTASYASKSFSVATQETGPRGIRFKSDGTKMYIVGSTADTVFQYSLSTAWDVSTASYDSVSLSVASEDTSPAGLYFSGDGTQLYIVGATNNSVYQYTLSTAWDLSTGSYASKSLSVASQDTNPSGVVINTDGTKLFVVGFSSDNVYQYNMSTAYDLSTASYASISFSVASQATVPKDLSFSTDGTKMYTGSVGTVYQYTTGTTTYSTTFDCENANVFETELDANTTVVFSNPPASVDWPAATAPTLTATASAVDQFVFYTYDGGTTWYGFTAGQALG